jgi:outer membrane protein OmpA-like peptidoglycan-associated protein
MIPSILFGQEGIGLPFLKIGIGARQAGLAGVFTGVADDVHTLYWNPGGLGHIRLWQWSASYNRWFTDVYQASLTMVKQFRFLGSRKTTLGFSANYLGMPSWDSTGGMKPSVSAGQFMGGVSLGQRLDWISRWLSVGATARVISSRYADYTDVGISTDVGLVLRPSRFKVGAIGMGLFDYGIITLGASVLHLGNAMTFDAVETSLPQTIRAGLSYRMGRYRGLSLLIASDAVGVQDRDWMFAVASEVWWRDLLAARIGYRFNGKDLGELSLGVGFRWHGVFSSLFDLPTRHGDALEINVANMGYGDVLQQTYRGSVSHYPEAPEPFRLDDPQVVSSHVLGTSSQVTLTWEEAPDPDPFDEVAYLLFVDRDYDRVDRAIHLVERDMPGFLASPLKDSLLVFADVSTPTYTTSFSERGVYYWAVAAYDLAKHARLAARGEEHVSEFVVATTDLLVRDIWLAPSQWITTTPEQGTLNITVANEGNVDADTFRVVLRDLTVGEPGFTLMDIMVPFLAFEADTTLSIDWETSLNGPHVMEGDVNGEPYNTEIYRENNILRKTIVSIPKGTLTVPDTVEVMVTASDYTEIPIVPEVYFALHSSDVDPYYYEDGVITPGVLQTLAERLNDNRNIVLKIMGSIDAMDGEADRALADERAESVKRVLVELGVFPSQLEIVSVHPRRVLGRGVVRSDPNDARWVGQQYRVVSFEVDEQYEEAVFHPYRVAVDTTLSDKGVSVMPDILTPGHTEDWFIEGHPREIQFTKPELAWDDSLKGMFYWNGRDVDEVLVPRNRWYTYQLVLTDKLERTFRTFVDSVYLREKRTLRRWEVFGSARFASVEPVYQFYWKRVMDLAEEMAQNPTMRIRFEGHACAIGPEAVNDRLSLRRAQAYTRVFKERIRQAYPQTYQEVWTRIAEPEGYGESTPLVIKSMEHGDVLLGDNESPAGRYLNRRTQVLLYKEN